MNARSTPIGRVVDTSHLPDPRAALTSAPALPGPERRLQTAMEQLQVSRERLRSELLPALREQAPQPAAHAPDAPTGGGLVGEVGRELRGWWRWGRRRVAQWPVASLAMAAVHSWWARHPMRPLAQSVAGEVHATVVPAVRRHPLLAVGAAALAGALLVRARPWRWAPVAHQARHLPRRVLPWLGSLLASAPVQTALTGLLFMLARRREGAAESGNLQGGPHGPQ